MWRQLDLMRASILMLYIYIIINIDRIVIIFFASNTITCLPTLTPRVI